MTLSIYTPTYNRAYILPQLYSSLLRQTVKDFEWLIIDDGSADNTKELVSEWIDENKITIRYYYQENKGKQEAVNLAHSKISAELNTCIDSDDFIVDDAVDFIIDFWSKIKNDNTLAGFVALDSYKNGEIVGTRFPVELDKTKFTSFYKYKIKGDKKFIYRTDVINQYPPYPSIRGEKFPAPGYLYRLIDQDYDLLLVNKVLCIVEYLSDGISSNKFTQFKNCPHSFAFYRLERMRLANSYKEKFRHSIHYINSCLFAKKSILKNNPYKLASVLAFPFGIVLYLYLKFTTKKGVK